jgi:transcriptional regulator with XRE-family HTH domain
MPRSLRVKRDRIQTVKLAVRRNGFPSQRSLAEEVGFALATVSNFLTGKPVDFLTFAELCRQLALDWKEVADLDLEVMGVTVDEIAERRKLPNLSPVYPNGAVPLGSNFYLERAQIEEQIDREITRPGALVRIKAPREMGKTSLLLRSLHEAKRQGYHTVSLNLEQVDRSILGDLPQFLRWLCANIARQLQLKPLLDDYWDEDLGSKISCSAYFQEYLLAQIDTALVLAIDEVNQIFEHPQVARDFLPLLRSWFEEAKTLAIWQKLRLIVVHSTDIYVPLQLTQSPFNVGLPIQLPYFGLEDVQRLAHCYGLSWSDGGEAQQLMGLVGGHPALVHTAIYHLSSGEIGLSQLLETAATPTGIYHHHLLRHWVTLAEQPELASALQTVMQANQPVALAPIVAHKLTSLGSISQSGDRFVPSCELYRQAFINRPLA